METVTATVVSIPGIADAFAAGQVGLGVGLLLMLVAGVLRRARFTGILDKTGAVVATALIGAAAVIGQQLATGASVTTVIVAAVETLLPVLASLFVKPR